MYSRQKYIKFVIKHCKATLCAVVGWLQVEELDPETCADVAAQLTQASTEAAAHLSIYRRLAKHLQVWRSIHAAWCLQPSRRLQSC